MMISNGCCRGFPKEKKQRVLDAVVPQSEIEPLYDSISPFYDLWGKLTESKARKRVLQLADIDDGSTILEVAVGTGLAFEQIVKHNPSGVNMGIDLSNGMLARARKRLSRLDTKNYSLSQGKAAALEIDSQSVDMLVNNYMFDLIPFKEMDAVLAEFRRVLKPHGKLVMANMTQGRGWTSRIYENVYRRFPKLMGGCRGVALSGRLQKHGFNVVTREYWMQMLFPSEVVLALKTDSG